MKPLEFKFRKKIIIPLSLFPYGELVISPIVKKQWFIIFFIFVYVKLLGELQTSFSITEVTM